MSIVVAVKKNREIALAADSQTNWGSFMVSPDNHRAVKVLKVASSYIATSGWAVYENILSDFIKRKKLPALTSRESIFAFFLKLWPVLHDRYAFVNDQCDEDDSPFGDLDASFLVVNSSGIYFVASDMSVTELEHYYAIGSGCDFGFGALHALYDRKLSAEQLARRAAQAAITFNVYCGGEIIIKRIKARR